MKYDDVVNYFGSASAVAKAINVSPAAVCKWRGLGYVPPLQAYRINRLTNGALKVGDDFFDDKDEVANAAREEHGAG